MKTKIANIVERTDIIPLENRKLSTAIERCLKKAVADKATSQRTGKHDKFACSEDEKRLKIRRDLMEGRASDPNGFERVIGESDLTSINFLDRGRRAAAAVCRIKMPMNEGFAYGTGFLVGARLLMTNNHVIASRAEASQVEAEFGFEHDIDGGKLIHPGARKDTWRQDIRIDKKYQPDNEFYVKSKKDEKVYFSRGHLVRLLDPCWGDQAADSKRGQEDTFHFTNAAPQVQKYNDSDWGNLEDYLLDKAQGTERKLTVFTGPIYLPDDPFYGRERKGGPWQVPLSFWKVAVLQKSATKIAAAAFIVGQTEYLQALYEAKVFSGLKPYTIDEMRSRKIQTTVAAIEEQTGLDFSVLRPFDAHGSLEATRQTRWINSLFDVLI